MRKYLIVIALLISTTCNAHVSTQQAVIVYKKLLKVMGIKKEPRLIVTKTKEVNAMSDGYAVYVTTAMLSILQNKDEVAAVLGHELSHHKVKDYFYQPSKFRELRADYNGVVYSSKAGYNKCRGLQFMKHMIKIFGEEGDDGAHPTWSYRYKRLAGGC
jgi:predicted Zn-dependent protease